jgi:hypothetical protein
LELGRNLEMSLTEDDKRFLRGMLAQERDSLYFKTNEHLYHLKKRKQRNNPDYLVKLEDGDLDEKGKNLVKNLNSVARILAEVVKAYPLGELDEVESD